MAYESHPHDVKSPKKRQTLRRILIKVVGACEHEEIRVFTYHQKSDERRFRGRRISQCLGAEHRLKQGCEPGRSATSGQRIKKLVYLHVG